MEHKPVLLNEVIKLLDPKPSEFFVDGTVGSGGHAVAILEKMMPNGKFLAMDWDKNNLEKSRSKIETKFPIPNLQFPVFWVNDNYSSLREFLEKEKLGEIDGLILDLGFSSEQIGGGRGFSFQTDEPLLMTYNTNAEPMKKILQELTEEELFKIIKEFGEERYAKKIAHAIYEQERKEPMETTLELVEVIKQAVPRSYERGRIHFATRTFMAFRIYVNHELENLEKVLKDFPEIMKSGGRLAIISFHSLEDRLVKNYFRDYKKAGKIEILTKKPIQPIREEISANPRSRSAKLRVAKII